MKRREFLAITAASSASLPVLARGRAWLNTAPEESAGIDFAIFDDRFAEARRFGRILHGRGCAVSGFHGDVTALWSGRLDTGWRDSADTVAGQTDKDCFFCLSQMAVSHGVYPKFRVEHVFTAGGVSHLLNGPADAVARAAAKLEAASDWVPATARLLASLDVQNASEIISKTVHAGPADGGRDAAGTRDAILVSWLMGPTRQARRARRAQSRR